MNISSSYHSQDGQIKAKCQEKLNEATINRLLQGVYTRTHTHTHARDNVRLLGANKQLADAHTVCTHRRTLKDIKCKCIFFFSFSPVLTTRSVRCGRGRRGAGSRSQDINRSPGISPGPDMMRFCIQQQCC